MKCRNIVNGKECGVDLSPNANCCVECGEDVRTIECPKCSTTVKETQKFCLNCKWKVEENAFVNKTSPSNVTHEEDPADESVGGLQHVPLYNEDVSEANKLKTETDNAFDKGKEDPIDETNDEYGNSQAGQTNSSSSEDSSSENEENSEMTHVKTTTSALENRKPEASPIKADASQVVAPTATLVNKEGTDVHVTGREKLVNTSHANKEQGSGAKSNDLPPKDKPISTKKTKRQKKQEKKELQKRMKERHKDIASIDPNTNRHLENEIYRRTESSNSSDKTGECVQIYFHAILSPTILSNHNKDVVLVKIKGKSQDLKMKYKRVIGNGFAEYEGMLCVEKGQPRSLVYNYYVKVGGKHDVDEFIYNQGHQEAITRFIDLKKIAMKDIHHQFDGVVRGKPVQEKDKPLLTKVFKRLSAWMGSDAYLKILRDDVELALKNFLPKWQISTESGMNGIELILRVQDIVRGMNNMYYSTEKLWSTWTDFDTHISKILKPYIELCISDLAKHRGHDRNLESIVIDISTAATVVYLKEEYVVKLDDSSLSKLCASLLPYIPNKKICCLVFKEITNIFSGRKKELCEFILKLVKALLKAGQVFYLYCMPLLHYLQDKYQPFQEAPDDVNHHDKSAVWWGIEHFKADLDCFKDKQKSLQKVIGSLLPFFELDFLLARTVVASMTFQELTTLKDDTIIPVDIIMAAVYYFVNTFKTLNLDAMQGFKQLFTTVSSVLLKMNTQKLNSFDEAKRAYIIGSDVLNLIFFSTKVDIQLRTRLWIAVSETFCIIANWIFNSISTNEVQLNELKFDPIDMFEKFKKGLAYELDVAQTDTWQDTEKWIQLWDESFNIKIPDGKIKTDYLKHMQTGFRTCLEKWKEPYKLKEIIDVYCSRVESFHPALQEILSICALEAVYVCIHDLPDSYQEYQGNQSKYYGALVSHVFERNLNENELKDKKSFLKHAMAWPPFPVFVRMCKNPEFANSLHEKCVKYMNVCIKAMNDACNELLQGQITLDVLKILLSGKQNFISIVEEINAFATEFIETTLCIREKELEAFTTTLAYVKEFVYVCRKIEGNTDDIEIALTDFKQANEIPLEKVCRLKRAERIETPTGDHSIPTYFFNNFEDIQQYQPFVTVLRFEAFDMDVIPQILLYTKIYSFSQIWKKTGREVKKNKGKKLRINEIILEVWKPSYTFWNSICYKLKTGDLLFTEFEDYFYQEETEIAEILRKEIAYSSTRGDTQWIQIRLDQFQNHKMIFDCLKGAKAIMAIVHTYDLKGDFSHVNEIINMTDGEDAAMKTFDDSLVKACSILGRIDDKKIESLVMFARCQPLVTWLKTSMSGLKELNVFVDLASMSAGETDIEVDRAQVLHSAATGYAPLIFSLNETCNDMEFIELCETVWKELETDKKLPKKLKHTIQHLDWFKSVKKSHGSVEISSLSQTKAINSNGIYEVGNSDMNNHSRTPALKEVLTLNVVQDVDSDDAESLRVNTRRYKYNQLLDLQSRLMLVAGKAEQGKDEVDRFMLIFDAVARLGNIYVKLVTDGCVLFNNWHATFLCDKNRPACAFLHFGHGQSMLTVKGRTDKHTEDVSAMIPKLAKILEKFHFEWLDYINNKRREYPLLNFFTTDQIVILQQQLVKMGTCVDPPSSIYPLLSAVKKECSRDDLIAAMTAAKIHISALDSGSSLDEENKHAQVDEVEDESIQEIIKCGFSRLLAKEALKKCKSVEDAIDWCYDHDDTYTETDVIQSERIQTSFTGWFDTEHTMATLTSSLVTEIDLKDQNESRKLKKALRKLWQKFLHSISSSLSDYLSIEHLGIILNKLNELDTFEVNRTMQTYLKEGEPNLIICEQCDLYNTLLSIYSHEFDQPLPQSDEVLLCGSETSLDTVDIFLRRSLYHTSNQIYCLVNVGQLDYEVSSRAEKVLQALLTDAEFIENPFRLVVICSTENENHSVISRALAKYQRQQLPIHLNNVQSYVLTKLTSVSTSPFDIKHASCVDFDKCTVRVVRSSRAGVGKTLFKDRMKKEMSKVLKLTPESRPHCLTIPLHEKKINIDDVVAVLLDEILPPHTRYPRIFHFDIAHEVHDGVDDFLFQLLILGCLHHNSGYVWRKSHIDYYIIESMPLLSIVADTKGENYDSIHQCLDILPSIVCCSPLESITILKGREKPKGFTERDRIFDRFEFESTTFQRPYQYLKRLDSDSSLHDVKPCLTEGDQIHCLQTLLRHCGIKDPSWAELYHFVSFLDKQLQDFEVSNFCGTAVLEDLPGFPKFVLKFLIQMSRDFSTRSLKISEETPLDMLKKNANDADNAAEIQVDNFIELYTMRRTWETSPHPYLFFNPDGHSMTFLGFNIDKRTGNLIDLQTRNILESGIMRTNLFEGLRRNKVNLTENFDTLPRYLKIRKLCDVMGVDDPHDPDESYELTTDNVKKILAIYMRFRCGIPVIIMGETGCGKTRLIKFMCDLQRPPEYLLPTIDNKEETKVEKVDDHENVEKNDNHENAEIEINEPDEDDYNLKNVEIEQNEPNVDDDIQVCYGRIHKQEEKTKLHIQNMILMKVHGGTTSADIFRQVKKAEDIARKNAEIIRKHKNLHTFKRMDTVLFFDEANTTEAIGAIKEIMCDKTLKGRQIEIHQRLKIVAACNPYRKHSDELIKRLEQAGLGYHVDADNTSDTLGRVPMRRLVYRVQPLPQSMLPLVWDFGQLNIVVEELYIRQMVIRKMNDRQIPRLTDLDRVISKILTVSQEFMRQQEDECSFVSLRDVERVLDVMSWFYKTTFDEDHFLRSSDSEDSSDEEDMFIETNPICHVTRSLVLALGVCYHSCLRKRAEYRQRIAKYFGNPLNLPGGANQIEEEIIRCQTAFLNHIELADNIAKNQALRENVFMMIVCIELRIPMFLVGKPGSSKSLAKTIVADTLQGNASHHEFFKSFKQVQMVAFQCSPLSTPDGIVGTFNQCASYQMDKDLDRFVSVVVLDEIGLAEDSPRMPLKTLHPLLEDGCSDNEEPAAYKKVAFIGISNWALDPAKMNRGILVQREVPDKEELINTAFGICSSDEDVQSFLAPMIAPMAVSYLQLFAEASKEMREFFGLRDFYSLIKMLYGFVSRSKEKPTLFQLKHSVLRNFGGLEVVDPVAIFLNNLSSQMDGNEQKRPTDPECSSSGMIQACLKGDDSSFSESRYLLLLVENYGALAILQQELLAINNVVVIFGSSFPSDQEYTQVCRNINRIKVCMETGSTAVLLNLENLYESLYDALNQYYVEFGDERYVDLGLGSHRVKCRVHRKFRLIVVAEKQIVYSKFPIPLINRLEKHFLSMVTMLTTRQLHLSRQLLEWSETFCEERSFVKRSKKQRQIGEAFIGYHPDTCPTIIKKVTQYSEIDADDESFKNEEEILQEAKSMMLWCATPAAILQAGNDEDIKKYFTDQHHDSLADYISNRMLIDYSVTRFIQITTNSRILSIVELADLCNTITVPTRNVHLLTLQSFHTEQQFSRQVKNCFAKKTCKAYLLIIQSERGDQNSELIACARYSVQRELQEIFQEDNISKVYVIFLIQQSGIAGSYFSGFQCGIWQSVHIDDLRASNSIPPIIFLFGKSVASVLSSTKECEITASSNERMNIQTRRDNNFSNTDHNLNSEDHYDCANPQKTEVNRLLDHLILNCIQRALASLKDPEEDQLRATERLKNTLNLLENSEDSNLVFSGIKKHVINLINEKEKRFGSTSNWLSLEVSKAENINKAGTFRKSIVLCLESRVLSILTGIFAFIDTNRNLDILVKNTSQNWSVSLWLDIWNNLDITQIRYEDMVSPTKHLEVMEVATKTTSVEGKLFSAKMPFSWLAFEQIRNIMRNVIDSEENKDDHTRVTLKVSEIFQSIPLGNLLSSADGSNIHDVHKCYIEDFVHMVYPFHSEDECKLVCENLVIGCKVLLKGEYGNILPSMVACHVVYELHSAQFTNFSHVVCVWPECCEKIFQIQKSGQNILVTTEEITIDILALTLLMEDIKPSRDSLYNPEARAKWLRKVCEYRPVIERIFANFNMACNANDSYYRRCEHAILKTRCDWTRTLVVKLFIENVCTCGIGTEILSSLKLWSKLGENTNLKELSSLEKVEAHLIKQNAEVLAKCFGVMSKCCICEADIQNMPFTLPCSHIICKKCYYQLIKNKHTCEVCGAEIPVDLKQGDLVNRENVEKYENFRSRCNSFFMEVVSQLCFSEGSLPSEAVMDKLLSYIIGIDQSDRGQTIVSRQLTVFHDAIDPNPVVRSFLLQEIMQTSGSNIKQHLSKYFIDTSKLLDSSGGQTEMIELCLLILQCMEDALQQNQQNLRDSQKELIQTAKMLHECSEQLPDKSGILDQIELIASIKYALSVVARYMQKTCRQSHIIPLSSDMKNMLKAAAELCYKYGSAWPRLYFVKEVCRNFGLDSYQAILEKEDIEDFQWVRLPDVEVKECFDRYIVNGPDYTKIRDAVTDMILMKNSDRLTRILQTNTQSQWQTNINVRLALYREITLNSLYIEEPKKIAQKRHEFVIECIQESVLIADEQDTVMLILNNNLWKIDARMNVYPTMDIGQQNIVCLLLHYRMLMSFLPGKTTLIMPLKNIAIHPEIMVESYYPAMPEDDVEFLTTVMRDFSKEHNLKSWHTGEDKPTFYKCPQGHPYAIGDCGNPYSVITCFCGEKIGGSGHVLLPGNKQTSSTDSLTKGHVLGRPENLKITDISIPRNELNRASFAMLRLLTHVSMYVGAEYNCEAVLQSIHTEPQIEESDLPSFILQHIELDIESLHQILGRGKDDIFMLIHHLLSEIMKYHSFNVIGGEHYSGEICTLSTRAARSDWEQLFDKTFILPMFKDMDGVLQKCNDSITDDNRMGSDPLIMLLQEKHHTTDETDIKNLYENPQVWRYRARITVDHLSQMLNSREETCKMLQLFLKEEHHLRVLRLIPNVIRLQKMLTKRFGRKLDRTEGAVLTIEKIKQQMDHGGTLNEFKEYLDSYTEAWEAVRQSLETYSCCANGGILRVGKSYCRKPIDDKTPVCYLLPTYKDTGLCAYLTLRFLLEKQNAFLDDYCRHKQIPYRSLPRVHVKDISVAHLISFHPDKDLLPMILANCNYSFEVGHGTKIDYNFVNLERQLMDRFLFSKSVIIGLNEIDVFTYRAENTNGAVLDALSKRIVQEKIPHVLQGQIELELQKIPFSDLCESLDRLDVAISFLKSVGTEQPQTLLYNFMTKVLKMEKSFPSQKAQQSIMCCHAMSWWMKLALERATSLMKYNQEPFEGIADNFTKPLTEKQKSFLEKTFSALPLDAISSLVELMFEFIVLKIDIQIDLEDDSYCNISDKSLCDYLKEFPDSLPYNESSVVDISLLKVIDSLTTDQNEDNQITIGHSVNFWTFINNMLITKHHQRN